VVRRRPARDRDALSGAGHAYVFDTFFGFPHRFVDEPYAEAYGFFGNRVSVSSTTVVVGAYGETANGQSHAGHAYSFDATGFLTTTLTSPTHNRPDGLAFSVAVSGTTVVVGAPFETGNGFGGAGHVYLWIP